MTVRFSDLTALRAHELTSWPLAATNYSTLGSALDRDTELGGWLRKRFVFYRKASSTAKIDAESLASRPCFLCRANRPEAQLGLPFGEWEILVNPYPLSPLHFTVVSAEHRPQSFLYALPAMTRLASMLPEMCVFYNGPACGASAPDHCHLQMVDRSMARPALLPVESLRPVAETVDGAIYRDPLEAPYPFFILRAPGPEDMTRLAESVFTSLPGSEPEPMANVAMIAGDGGNLIAFIAPRERHRPLCYGSGPGEMLVSPATIEMLGTLGTFRPEDFDRLDYNKACEILSGVGLSRERMEETVGRIQNRFRS